ncbi:RrF2 family transcriptional regulator [Anoxynatronum buryatiense]|uniref:Transcriptional regulator, BadM/Rrf2 family n=1 Tax=Anoxynatronum buryatiense TaxID=489973 RepID=A0AA45WY96_9CLOT|nr:Rrf2 family transcriptional regulator [Anoxynatronum buryatiense]SMP66041.1 transcriptional regulator, BadM/Rrf2 family [Anoxynatronum buryatiense]
MKLSTKGRYGLRALVDLVLHANGEQVPLVSIAGRQAISVQYLEHVFSALRKGGIVKSIKGPRGGYTLAEPPERMTISRVLQAVEGTHAIMQELGKEEENPGNTIEQVIRESLWQPIDEAVAGILEQVTLADLAEEARRKEADNSPMFYI